MLRAGGAPCRVGPVSSTLGHAGETFFYPKCSLLVSRWLDTSLGYFREVSGPCHLCGGTALQLSRIGSFSGICSVLKQPAAPFVAHGVPLPPLSHLLSTVQAWPNPSLKADTSRRSSSVVIVYSCGAALCGLARTLGHAGDTFS